MFITLSKIFLKYHCGNIILKQKRLITFIIFVCASQKKIYPKEISTFPEYLHNYLFFSSANLSRSQSSLCLSKLSPFAASFFPSVIDIIQPIMVATII